MKLAIVEKSDNEFNLGLGSQFRRVAIKQSRSFSYNNLAGACQINIMSKWITL
jgi:hypothetical protein